MGAVIVVRSLEKAEDPSNYETGINSIHVCMSCSGWHNGRGYSLEIRQITDCIASMQITTRIQIVLAMVTITSLSFLPFASANHHASHLEPGFKSLFNGKDLAGWTGNPNLWSVEDGAITGKTGETSKNKLTHNTFIIYTGGSVDDFELRLKYRIENGNSGIQYRSNVLSEGEFGPIIGGYQADFEAGTTYSGILYEEKGRAILAKRGQVTKILTNPDNPKKPIVQVIGSVGETEDIQSVIKSEEWNDYTIIANGNQLTHIINGRVTVSVIDEDMTGSSKSGVLALQIHVGPVMTVQFKDIRIREIK